MSYAKTPEERQAAFDRLVQFAKGPPERPDRTLWERIANPPPFSDALLRKIFQKRTAVRA